MNREKNKSRLNPLATALSSLLFLFSIMAFADAQSGQNTAEAEMASLSRASDLLEKPNTGSKVLLKLKADSKVQVLERKGAWAKVSTQKQEEGYVRLLNLRTIGNKRGSSGIGTLVKTFRTGSSGQSVATGVKGMSSEELKSSKSDSTQVDLLATFQVDKKEAKKAAKEIGLKTKKVDELPNKDK